MHFIPGSLFDVVGTTALLLCLYIGIPVLILTALYWRRQPSKEETEALVQQFMDLMVTPDYEGLERHYGHKVSDTIRQLYDNHEEMLREDFSIVVSLSGKPAEEWYIAGYEPADVGGIQSSSNYTSALDRYLPIASDGMGNYYIIDIRLEDPPVYFYDHETGQQEPVCNSITEFLSLPRKAADDTAR